MKRTILLADDSPTIQRIVDQILTGGGYTVVPVSNGEAALRKLEEIRPAAVLADTYMPGKNGYEVCAHVRSRPELAGIPVLLLVGAFEAFDEAAAKRAGANGKIAKPFEPQLLLDAVAALLEAAPAEAPAAAETDGDILGLTALFPVPSAEAPPRAALSEEELEAIVDRVVRKLTSEVVEGIAWDIVPDIAERVVREELKKSRNE